MERDQDDDGAGAAVPAVGPLLERVAGFYHQTLLRGSRGLKWLAKRGLEDGHLLETYGLGHCDGTLMKVLAAGDPKRQDFLRAGLVVGEDGRHTERLLNHITVPLVDADGGMVALCGIGMDRSGGAILVPDDACAPWNLPAARIYPEIVLCGSILDGLALVRAGLPNVLALVEGMPGQDGISRLQSLGVQRVAVLAQQDAVNRIRPLCAALEFAGIPLPASELPGAMLVRDGAGALVNFVEARLRTAAVERPADRGVEGHVPVADGSVPATFGGRRYMLCGIEKGARRLRATLRTEFRGKLHVDTLDFYNARCRRSLAQDLCRLFGEPAGVIETDIGRLIKVCETHDPRQAQEGPSPVILTPEERAEAESFGCQADLLDRIVGDYDACGLIGERSNKLVSYLAALSRKLDDPLSVLVLSSSGAGKSALQDATLAFCPPEDVVKLTSLSGKALFYKGRTSLKHKILAVEEGAGAQEASYAIRALVSAKELVIETAMKDFGTGRITTMENRVEGPTSVFITTTDPDIDAETRSRFVVLTVDESREQTRAILEYQRRRQTLEAMATRESREAILARHRNFQRLLKPVMVVNPHAGECRFLDDRLQSRRDHPKYLNLIRAVAFLCQMGREVKTAPGRDGGPVPYIEATREDVEMAGRLMEESSGRDPDDLNGVSRALLIQIGRLVAERVKALREADPGHVAVAADVQFTRRDIREFTGWSHMRVKRYLRQLVELELVAVVSGRFGVTYHYRLCAGGEEPGHDLVGTWSPAENDTSGSVPGRNNGPGSTR